MGSSSGNRVSVKLLDRWFVFKGVGVVLVEGACWESLFLREIGAMGRRIAILLALFCLLAASTARGQGVLIVVDPNQSVRLPRPPIIWPPYPHPPHPIPHPRPEPPATYKIGELEVDARLVDQVAQVQVSQSFVNTGSTQLEVSFVFPLPYDGAVDSLTLLVDGKEFPAKLLPADEARRLYEDIVRKNKDPALLEWMGTGLFKTSVFPVPAGAKPPVVEPEPASAGH